MKKITFLMVAIIATLFVNAQTVVFNETCGSDGASSNPRPSVDDYEGWDNFGVVAFSHTTDRYPDVRQTSTLDSHVWFPATYDSDMVIDQIDTEGYTNLKLSFDVATNTNNSDANVNKVIVEANDVAVTVPSVAFTGQNSYASSGEISIPDGTTKLRFYYTAANNPANFGYRIDNIKITGTGGTSAVETVNNNSIKIYSNDGNIVVDNAKAGELLQVYNVTGQMLVNQVAVDGKNTISFVATQGLLIVRCGDKTEKIVL